MKARTISRYGEGVHTQIFLLKDNKDFLPPKKLIESHIGREIKDGKELNTMHPWYHFTKSVEQVKKYKIMDYVKLVPINETKKDK